MDTKVHSQPMDSNFNETTETDFNSTLLDDGTLFSSHTVNTLIGLGSHDDNNSNITITNDTTSNTNIYENHRHRQSAKSTELTQNSDPLNTILPKLPNKNTHLARLQRQNSAHFNTKPIILKTSTQPTLTNNQNIQLTPQQLVNFFRHLNSQKSKIYAQWIKILLMRST